MRTFQLFQLIVASSLLAAALPVIADDQAAKNLATPPILQKLDEGSDPGITISKPESDNERKITEKREQGRVTEVKVKKGKNTYFVKPNTPLGSAMPGDAQAAGNRGAQWQVLEFDGALKTPPAPPAPPAAKDADKTEAPPPPKAPAASK